MVGFLRHEFALPGNIVRARGRADSVKDACPAPTGVAWRLHMGLHADCVTVACQLLLTGSVWHSVEHRYAIWKR